MMLKVESEYLDFNGTVELEQKVKLFENLDSSDGDVSFQFDVEETSKNVRLLNYPIADHLTKSTYRRINCDLQDDSGVSLQVGFLRIERRIKRDRIALSFFSGNSNWFGLISGNLSELDMSQYDIDQTIANIESSWSNTEGIAFPLVDNGGLLTRSYPHVKIEDFVGAFYVKTVFKKIFQASYIKLQGELFEDPFYNALITLKNSKSQTEIDARSTYVHTSNSPDPNGGLGYTKMVFDDDFNFPYFDGSQDNFSLVDDRYTADVKMVVKADLTINETIVPGLVGEYRVAFYVNGVSVSELIFFTPKDPVVYSALISMEAGDYLEVYTYNEAQISADPITDATLKITPNFVYKTFGTAAVPNWTKQEYVSAIFQVFNVITSFEPKTKTLTCNLFDKIKEKEPIDISEYVTVEETDFESFISSFGKKSTFSYNEVDFDEIKDYNIANYFKYGQGFLEVNNDFIPEEESVIESNFSNPLSYINGVFDMSMERLNLIELDEGDSTEITSVSDNGGIARFNIADDLFILGDLIRITESSNPAYNGDYIINAQATGYFELAGVGFDATATATVTKLNYTYNNSDDVFLLVNIPLYETSKFTGNPSILFEDEVKTSLGLAYFALLNTNRQINIDYKQSLSFGEIQDPLFYQRTILETYWSLVSRVLNDPVKLINTGLMPTNVYRSIDFLRPLMVKTLESSNLYYCNTISGYKSSYENFRIDTIKLP